MIHRPGPDGLFAQTALCGAGVSDLPPSETFTMHEWEYDCPECARLSGEPPC